MAQVSKICSGVQNFQIFHEIPKTQIPKSVNLFSTRSQFVGKSNFRGLKQKCSPGNAVVSLRVSASIATTEIVLKPIREISGTIQLPGSKSLSHRILLLAALSEL